MRSQKLSRAGDRIQPSRLQEYLAHYATQWLRRQTALMGLAKYTGTIPEFLETTQPG